MTEKLCSDLNLAIPVGVLPSIEVDIDSIPSNYLDYVDLITQILKPLVGSSPNLTASIYTFQSDSINFGQLGFSAFLCVVGKEGLLEKLHSGLIKIEGVKARFSDHIDSALLAACELHIQDGYIWYPIDAMRWCSDSEQNTTCGGENRIARIANPVRFRIARADASVRSVKKTIEVIMGLPEGSVALCDPSGKALRADAKIATLRKRWM